MSKVSQLPAAMPPITGEEVMELLQTGGNVKTPVNTARRLKIYNGLPGSAANGTLAYMRNEVGGPTPIIFDGLIWRVVRTGNPAVPG